MPWWDKLVSGLAGTPRTDATESATSPPAAAAKEPEPSPPHGCASDRLAGVAPSTHGAGPSNVGDEEWSEPPDSPGGAGGTAGASGGASGDAESGCDGEEGEGEAGGGGKSEAGSATPRSS